MSENVIPTAKIISPSQNKNSPRIWAMGGGKGGVGKSFIISNIAIALAKSGKRVTIIDLDLGSANLHTCLGSDIPQKTLSDFFAGRVHSLDQLVNRTDIANLSFISGANDSVSAANITDAQHASMMRALKSIQTDYLLIDLGAGTLSTTLDYFLLADKAIVGITPEPTSIENAYRFIKSAFYRWIKSTESRLGLKAIVDQAMDHKNSLGIRTPSDLLNRLIALNPALEKQLQAEINKFQVHLIMNQVRTKNDVEMGHAVKNVCKKYFGVDTHYVGYLDYDNAVWQSLRKKRPLVLEFPYSNLVGSFQNIVKSLEENEGPQRTNILRTA